MNKRKQTCSTGEFKYRKLSGKLTEPRLCTRIILVKRGDNEPARANTDIFDTFDFFLFFCVSESKSWVGIFANLC